MTSQAAATVDGAIPTDSVQVDAEALALRSTTVRIGLTSEAAAQSQSRGVRIPDGSPLPPRNARRAVWLDSLTAVGQLLSAENVKLLEIVRDEQPPSIAALAARTGRRPSNVARTLRSMARYGLIDTAPGRGKSKPPRIAFYRLLVVLHKPASPESTRAGAKPISLHPKLSERTHR